MADSNQKENRISVRKYLLLILSIMILFVTSPIEVSAYKSPSTVNMNVLRANNIANLIANFGSNISDVTVHGQQMLVNLKVTNESDITNDLNTAISVIDAQGGGVLNIPYKAEGYNIIVGNIQLCDNLTIKGNNSIMNIASSPVYMNVFRSNNIINFKASDLSFISTNDKTRVIGRSGLGSNISAFTVHGQQMEFENIYCENLEYGFNIKNLSGLGAPSTGISSGIKIYNLKTYQTKQPIYFYNVVDSYFDSLSLDNAKGTDSYDHQIYVNGLCSNLTFNNLSLINGVGYAMVIKNDNGVDLNTNINITNLKTLNSLGVYLQGVQHVSLTNIDLKSSLITGITGSGISISGALNKNIKVNEFSIDGFYNAISTNTKDTTTDVDFENGFIANAKGNTIAMNKTDNFNFKSITFKNIPLGAGARHFHTNALGDNKFTVKDCSFIFEASPRISAFSIRGKDEVTIENCQFINNGVVFGFIMQNIGEAKVIAKNNTYKRFLKFKCAGDTATIEDNDNALCL